MRYGTTT